MHNISSLSGRLIRFSIFSNVTSIHSQPIGLQNICHTYSKVLSPDVGSANNPPKPSTVPSMAKKWPLRMPSPWTSQNPFNTAEPPASMACWPWISSNAQQLFAHWPSIWANAKKSCMPSQPTPVPRALTHWWTSKVAQALCLPTLAWPPASCPAAI